MLILKKNTKKIKISLFAKIVWIILSIIEWISVPLYIAAMGYEINIEVYNKIKDWEYIANLFYILSLTAAAGFLFFSIKFALLKLQKERVIAQVSCIVQLILVISKLRI